uniref:Transposase, MuDR, MULE transposase domain protein n=1 Tax=Tanacetum cinerariifolium TaxID=118510 RepID=A0A6L2MHN2_TANCI|nr:transposase, MuDR, MULE transposase domain protein [Tanacetum cinerariifolium]
MPTKAIQDQMQKQFHMGVSIHKAFREKAKAKTAIKGDAEVQYALLRDYVLELQKCNPNTTVKLYYFRKGDPESTTRLFRRIYVCLGALKEGFKAGGRELLRLDRAFMKGRAHCDLLINSICEVFNRQLLEAKDSPIISTLEYTREYLMKKIVIMQKVIEKGQGPLTPAAIIIFNKIKEASVNYIVDWIMLDLYQVKGHRGD